MRLAALGSVPASDVADTHADNPTGADRSIHPAHTARDRPRVEFSLDADDRAQVTLDVDALLAGLLESTPAVFGGWTVISLRDRTG